MDSPLEINAIANLVEDWLGSCNGQFRRLAIDELLPYSKRLIVCGWRLQINFHNNVRFLDICLDENCPRTVALAFIVNPPKHLTWPHVYRDGMLCLWPDSVQVDWANPLGNFQEVLAKAVTLIEELLLDGKQKDFRDEFDSYWSQSISAHSVTILSLLNPTPPSRHVLLYRSRNYYLIGDDEASIISWLRHRLGKPRFVPKLMGATFIWLNTPWLPSEYPRKADQVLSLVDSVRLDTAGVIQQLLFKEMRESSLVIGAPTTNGSCLAGIILNPPEHKYRSNSLEKGFRPGHANPRVLRARVSGTCTVSRSMVYRVDTNWVHGRGNDPNVPSLNNAKVAILGCGSIGAAIAIAIAQAGVGNLTLVDPELLSAANIGRHPLGAENLLNSKVKALSQHITQRFPHMNNVFIHEKKYEELVKLNVNPLADCDLIVSAMGNWGSESALNSWNISRINSCPIVYGWTEPFACAGHAVAIMNESSCFQCGMSTRGTPALTATDWSTDTMKQEPGCGTFYQPYGPIDLAHVNALIAELVIECLLTPSIESVHRVWACRRSVLETAGGNWSKMWQALPGFRPEGAFVQDLAWPMNHLCVCKESRHA